MGKLFTATLALLALALIAGTANAITAQMTDLTGTPLNLTLDIDATQGSTYQGVIFQYCNSSSYSDMAYCNPNAFVKICDPLNLTGNYTGIAYKVGTKWILVSSYGGQSMGTLFPIKNWDDGTQCALVDVDLSFFRAVYPSIPEVIFSTDPTADNGDTFIPLTEQTMLKGVYVFTNQTLANDRLALTVTGAFASAVRAEYNASLLVIGVEDPTQQVCDVDIGYLGNTSNLSLTNGLIDCRAGTVVNINGIRTPVDLMYCNDGIQNYGETGIDCGGPCPPCPVNVSTYLTFVKPDGTPGCLDIATEPFNVTVRLVIGGQRFCDLNYTWLNVTYPNGTLETMNATNCSNGDHLFPINANQSGTYHFQAFTTALQYTARPVNCTTTYNPTEFIARLPDSNLLVVIVTMMAAFFLFFRRRNAKK